MKKLIVAFGISMLLVSCRPNVNNFEAQKKLEADSIAEIETLMLGDSAKKRRRKQWVLNDMIAMNNRPTISKKILEKYVGIYEGGLEFYLKEDYLFCKTPKHKNVIYKLYPVNDSLLEWDQTVQVEFVKDSEGKYPTIKMHLANGGIVELNRMLDVLPK